VKAPGVIYRLGRKPDPWAPPDWASAGPDGTFGNRFDDLNADSGICDGRRQG
jgi:hypothetical protein